MVLFVRKYGSCYTRQVAPTKRNIHGSKAEHQGGICYSTEIIHKGIFREKDNPKCENIGCQVIFSSRCNWKMEKVIALFIPFRVC